MSDVRGVQCPCCKELLYSYGFMQEGVAGLTKESPRIQNDSDGSFMTCPHCSKRIAMIQVPGGPSGVSYNLAPVQKCA